LTISRGPCRALGLACSPEPPLHHHAVVPYGFHRPVRWLTRKHLSRPPPSKTRIRLAVLHGAHSRVIRLVPPNEGCRLPPRIGAPPVASWPALNVDDLPPLLHGHYPASTLLRSSPPLTGALVLSASRVRRLCLFPWHRRAGSQVPYKSPNESHASYTPDTAWPVGRFPPRSSWNKGTAPVLMPVTSFRCVTRGLLALVSLIHT